jgi:hypothetical protein
MDVCIQRPVALPAHQQVQRCVCKPGAQLLRYTVRRMEHNEKALFIKYDAGSNN